MTKLPAPEHLVSANHEQPRYEPQRRCSAPSCGHLGREHLELHHLFRRSFIGGDVAWVDIGEETVGNLVYLCPDHHRLITENKAEIAWTNKRFWWVDLRPGGGTELRLLVPQPPLSPLSSGPAVSAPPSGGATTEGANTGVAQGRGGPTREEMQVRTLLPDAPSTDPGLDPDSRDKHQLEPGEECPACHRRVPHPKKPSTPQERRQRNIGRGPAEIVESNAQRAEDLAKALGLYRKPDWGLKLEHLMLTIVEQVELETLQRVAKEIPWA